MLLVWAYSLFEDMGASQMQECIETRLPANARLVSLFLWTAVCIAAGIAFPVSAQDAAACGDQPAVYAVGTGSERDFGQRSGGLPEAFINDYVTLGVCRLDALLASAQARQQDLTLYINGVDSGLKPSAVDHDDAALTFTLDLTPQNKELWKPLLYNPLLARHETLHLSVGTANAQPLPKLPNARTEIRFNKLWVDAWTIGLVALLVVIAATTVYWARNSDMLRDGPSIGKVRQSYSLGRVQMAWWFNLIVLGYVAIWLVTGEQDTITGSLVALMGISAVTGLSAAAVTPSASRRAAALKAQFAEQRAALDHAVLELDAEIESIIRRAPAATLPSAEVSVALESTGGGAGVDPKPAPGGFGTPIPGSAAAALVEALRAKKADREREREQLSLSMSGISPLMASRGFWRDLVTDDRGAAALDRLQVVVWTAVLSSLFLYSVLFYLAMPEFSETMLLLMGISSGTYIGFKLPEQRS